MTIVKKFFVTFALILLTCSTCAAQEQNFEMLATTYSDESGSALTLIRTKANGELYFAVTEAASKSLAFVPFDRKTFDFYLNKDEFGGYPPLMFVIMLPDEARGGSDENLGVWQENLHLIPVYALFDIRDGQMIFDAPYFYSGEGTLTPSHYHSNITDAVHTRLIKIFMTHMPELHKQARGIQLP